MQFRLEGEKVRKPRLYDVCGLPNVYLVNGYRVTRRDGDEYVSVADVDGLHRAIARHLVLRRKVLGPPEVRFIRKTLDMTQADLAKNLSVTSQSVARWEKGVCEIPGTAEKLLRAVFLAHNLREDDDLHVIQSLLVKAMNELDQQDELEPSQASFQLDNTWSETELKTAVGF